VRGWRSVLLELLPSEIMLGKGSWVTQRVTRFSIDSTTVVVDSLVLLNGQQRIALGGTISKDVTRSMAFEVENVALANLEPYLGGPRLRGMISGDGSVHDLYGDPFALAYICADSIAVQDKPVGDIRFTAGWAPGARSLDLAGSLTRGPIKALDFEGTLGLFDGGELDVTLLFDRFDLAFINPYLPEGISEMQGLVSGDLGVHGTLLAPEVNGTLDLTDAGLRIDYLNTLYRFSHRLKVYPDMFALDRVRVLDEEGNVVREYDDTPDGFGRIAATTARQVLLTRLREAEDDVTHSEFAGREGDLISGVIQQNSNPRMVRVDIGKVEANLPPEEQVPGESYVHGERIKGIVTAVR
jgi:hypothetical protein